MVILVALLLSVVLMPLLYRIITDISWSSRAEEFNIYIMRKPSDSSDFNKSTDEVKSADCGSCSDKDWSKLLRCRQSILSFSDSPTLEKLRKNGSISCDNFALIGKTRATSIRPKIPSFFCCVNNSFAGPEIRSIVIVVQPVDTLYQVAHAPDCVYLEVTFELA